MEIYQDVCPECDLKFWNNSVTTMFGCPDCDPLLEAEAYADYVFGDDLSKQRCYFIVNGESCGKEAKYALDTETHKAVPVDLRVATFCREHFRAAYVAKRLRSREIGGAA